MTDREEGDSVIDQYIQQYGRRLYGLCMHLCANRFEADDLYQDTWIRLNKARKLLKEVLTDETDLSV